MSLKKNGKEGWKAIATLDDALSMGLSEPEFKHLIDVLGRDINIVELGVSAALYSEHCSYKSSKVHLKGLPTEGVRVIQGPGENAGVVDIGDNQAVVFKIESHNHPSFIEPFQGAATGVGGILRDVFTMGARPLALMNALRFGSADEPRTKYLLSQAVSGIGGYGNCMGIPTVGGELFFHEAYNGNCLVNAFALGLVDQDKIFLGQASGPGNSIFYVGSKTGRDGIHGACMASESFGDDSESKRPTVQVGDPFQEKLLLEACLEVMRTGVVVGIQDMGAAGITSSTYEMADRAGCGIELHLDRVPQRETGMTPYDIMLSESQERMLVVIQKGEEARVVEIFQRWGLDAVQIGTVKEGQDVELYWHSELVSSIAASLLTCSVPQYRWPESVPNDYVPDAHDYQPKHHDPDLTAPELEERWLALLGSINLCSRYPVFRQYDSTVRSNTVVHPGGDAAVIRVKREGKLGQSGEAAVEKGIAMTLDCNSRYCAADPRQGAALSLAESYRNISAVGAVPIGLSDNLNFGNPQKPEGMWQLAEGCRGLGEAARAFSVPIVSGNVSLYNETKGKAILPTPVVALVGLIEDASLCVTIAFKNKADKILVFGETREDEQRASEYRAMYPGNERGRLPLLDYDKEIATGNFMRELINRRLIISCHDISSGGLACALAECCLGVYSQIGASLSVADYQGSKEGLLFAESGARYIVSCQPNCEVQIRDLAKELGIPITLDGLVGGTDIEIKGVAKLDLGLAHEKWSSGLNSLFGCN